jgi:hypothetical protein
MLDWIEEGQRGPWEIKHFEADVIREKGIAQRFIEFIRSLRCPKRK